MLRLDNDCQTRAIQVRPIDHEAICRYRLRQIRTKLAEADLAGIVLLDPINIRYATGTRNMQVWSMHHVCRYAFVATQGPVVLFEYSGSLHLSKEIRLIDER